MATHRETMHSGALLARLLLSVAVLAGAFYWLQRIGWVAPIPTMLFAFLLVLMVTFSLVAYRVWPGDVGGRDLHIRIMVQLSVVIVCIYSTGWGPMLAVGVTLVAAENLALSGSKAMWPAIGWGLVGITLGQIGIAVHAFQSLYAQPRVHVFAVMTGLGFVSGTFLLGRAAERFERADAQVRDSERRLRALVQHGNDVILVADVDRRISFVSPSIERVLGFIPEALVGAELTRHVHPDDRSALTDVADRLEDLPGGTESIVIRMSRRDGRARHMEVHLTNLLDEAGVEGFVVNFRDITDRKQFEEQLQHRAYHDSLTGLPNRAAFLDRIDGALARARRQQRSVAVIFIDLDDFKHVNDSLGHGAGDALLVEVAKRLKAQIREEDDVSRFGGDEFTVLLQSVDHIDDAIPVAERIVAAVRQPMVISGRELNVSASIGIAASAGDADATELLRNADLAMYLAKENGRDRFELYDGQHTPRVLERLDLEADLRRALANDEIMVEYQPIVSFLDRDIVGLEALARWHHRGRGVLMPGAFLGQAEESMLIVQIDRLVLRAACAQWSAWNRGQWPHVSMLPRMYVNVSPRWLREEGAAEEISQIVGQYEMDPRSLVVEVSERAAVSDDPPVANAIGGLRRTGIKVAIDDFGTGHSSLASLKRFRVDVLKLDPGTIADLGSERGTNSVETAIVGAVIEMGHALDIVISAKGVERSEQADILRRLGCDQGQGFGLARPMSAELVVEMATRGFDLLASETA